MIAPNSLRLTFMAESANSAARIRRRPTYSTKMELDESSELAEKLPSTPM
jgi:hypothetical protein